jgi:hypothetical protein
MAQRESTYTDKRSNWRIGMNCRFSDINSPGFWVNNHTGQGYRITDESLRTGHSPVIGYVSNWDNFTYVNSDPYAPIGRVRKDAADLDLPVNF